MKIYTIATLIIGYVFVTELKWLLSWCTFFLLACLSSIVGILVAFIIKVYTSPKVFWVQTYNIKNLKITLEQLLSETAVEH